MLERLINHWVYGGLLAGILLLGLIPVFATLWPVALTATFLQLPIYMLHQYEEHDNDRFRVFLNRTLGKGRDILSPAAVFVINVPGVWGVNLAALYLAWAVNPGLGLIAAYLAVVNAVVHIAHAIHFRRYNPGLATAVLLFLPLGGFCIAEIQRAGYGSAVHHLIGLGTAIGIHAVIVGYVLNRVSSGKPVIVE
jgi:hypothetical protein